MFSVSLYFLLTQWPLSPQTMTLAKESLGCAGKKLSLLPNSRERPSYARNNNGITEPNWMFEYSSNLERLMRLDAINISELALFEVRHDMTKAAQYGDSK